MHVPRILTLPALLLALATTGCLTINLPGTDLAPLVESVIDGGDATGPKILLVEIDGVIRENPEAPGLFGFESEGMVGRLREELNLARQDDQIRALLLRINSPGGTATGSDLIYQELVRFKQERGIPIVAQLMGVAASGGYYVAQAADAIHAQPTTVTGSIGVVMTGVNLSGLMDKLGIQDQTLTTGDFKDTGSMLRPMRADERAQLQSVLDDLLARFLFVVQQGRSNLDEAAIRELADGRVFSARRALELGLVDSVGSLDQTFADARRRAGLRSAQLVTYHRPREYANNVYTRVPQASGLRGGAPTILQGPGLEAPAFLYLWAPGSGL